VSIKLASPIFASLVALSLVACGKKDEAAASALLTQAVAEAASASAVPAAAAPAAAAAGPGKILAQCMKKDVAQCTETYRFVPELASDMCKGLEGTGVFTKGEAACPKDGLVATCEFVGETQTEITYHYREKNLPLAQTVDGARAGCTMVNGKLTVAPEPEKAGPAAKAAKAAPSKKK
jgi:hypothetical protein